MKFMLLAGVAMVCCSSALQAQVAAADDGDVEIVVTGQRAQQERSIEAKRNAVGIIDVAAADDIGRLPDRNVAEVLDRVSGVGVLYDQGEGRYVSIRGIPAELNGYTVNGFEIGNPDAGTRALPLDVISGQLLNRVEVAKLKTADMNGQGIGGTTNLVTNTAFDFREPFVVQASGQAGYQELNKKIATRGDFSVGGRFGSDEQFGLLVGVSYSDRPFGSYGFFPDDWVFDDTAARGGYPINIKYSEYSVDRARNGATGSLDWRPDDTTQLYVRGIYSKVIEDEYRQRYRLDFKNLNFNADGLTGVATGTERRQDLRLDHNSKSVIVGMIGGSKQIDALTLDLSGARVRNVYHEQDRVWQFRGNPGDANFDFTPKVYTAAPLVELTGDTLRFRQFTDRDAFGSENSWLARFDATYRLAGDSFVKGGLNFRSTDKYYDNSNALYSPSSANRFAMSAYGLEGDPVTVYPVPDRGYLNAPTIDADAMEAFTAQNLGSKFMPINAATTLANNTVSDFDQNEKVYAAYAYGNFEFGQATLTPGLRFEHTRTQVAGYSLQNGTTVVPVTGKGDYSNWLPSVILRIKPTDEVVLRLGYARAIGRPQFADLSPGSTLSTADETVSLGNPALKPYVADSVDASAEWYFARGGLVSVAAFAKWIKDPIYSSSYVLNDVTYAGQTFSRLEFTQPLNADKGHIYGLEASYQQQFTFLPGLLSGFGINLNMTLTDGAVSVPGRTADATFPNQSDLIYGAQLFYQKGPIEASLAYHHTGRSLLALGGAPDNANQPEDLNDQYSDDYRRLDAKISYAITENIHVFAEGQNLNDEPTRQYQAGIRDWTIQNERYGRSFYLGASVRF